MLLPSRNSCQYDLADQNEPDRPRYDFAGVSTALVLQRRMRGFEFGKDNPRDLWKYMAAYEEKTGGNVLAIAHNGNLSNGRMFPIIESFTGKPVDREYAEQRAKWERLYEATQIKGEQMSSAREDAGVEHFEPDLGMARAQGTAIPLAL